MLRNLRLRNFKGWKDTNEIALSPITVLTGANSSGKSSIGQFLMMLKQTTETSDRKAVFIPGGRNSAVQLGSYQEMVFRRNPKNKISFDYSFDLEKPLKIHDPVTRENYTGDCLHFEAEVGTDANEKSSWLLQRLKYTLTDCGIPTLDIGMRRNADGIGYAIVDPASFLKRNIGRPIDKITPFRFYGFPDEVVTSYQNAEFVKELNFTHESLYRKMYYLGPLRSRTERLYSWNGDEPDSVGYSGENTIASLLAAKDRRIGVDNHRYKPFQAMIAEELKKMGLIEKFDIKRISEARNEYEVKVTTKGADESVDLPDVGFGISQLLPVLTQCLYAPIGSIIIMEQPEIHLHPKAQAALADVMIDVIRSRENGKHRNIQLVIETHSEHFLRRLQRRIAEDVIEQSMVSAYFANIDRSPATLDRLIINTYGDIENWPKDFFGDEMGDIMMQSKASIDKRLKVARIAHEVNE